MSEIRFHTPEDVEVTYAPAGPGTRYLAVFIDQLIITVTTFVLFLGLVALGFAIAPFVKELADSLEDVDPTAGVWIVLAAMFLIKFLADTAYYIVCEIMMHGQTPGKRYMKIQVIQDGGYPLTLTACLLRNLMRVVDNIPLCWPVLLFSPQHKRIGDYVAGTLVVSKRPARGVAARVRGPLYSDLAAHQFEFTADHLGKLGDEDLELIESYFERRPTLAPQAGNRLRHRICESLAQRLGIALTADAAEQQRFLEELGAFLREQTLKRQI